MNQGKQTIKRVLIANRGEIAVRIIRTLRDLGISSVAIYSDPDRGSLHTRLADYAVRIPGDTSAETYLQIPKIIHAIKVSGADAVHPGYGFLSENSEFVGAVEKAGCTFIGPTQDSMNILGDKVQAKALMRQHDVPVTPGSIGGLDSYEALKDLVEEMGYPLILKAAAGGGGRGMRVIRDESTLKDSFDSCQREALEYFGNPLIFAERFVEKPRHIEVQVLCDAHGNGVHLFERDCSVQRRHQKLIEEAPSQFLSDEQRQHIGGIAVKAALAAGYRGVGTVEFICESRDKIYFMEMNTRIQVEHTVTEEITRMDLVAEQIRVAQGHPLSVTQDDLRPQGWSIECRINAEDPAEGFIPGPGRITKLRLPHGPHVRVDTHIFEGYTVPSHYDSMIAKLIVWGPNRDEAILRMRRALSEMVIEGIPTTARFHEAVLTDELFVQADINTGYVEDRWDHLKAQMVGAGTTHQDLSAALAAIKVQDQWGQREVTKGSGQSRWKMMARSEATHQ